MKMSIILMTIKKCSSPKKDAIDLSFDGIRAHAFSFLINVIIIMTKQYTRCFCKYYFLALPEKHPSAVTSIPTSFNVLLIMLII